MANPIQNSKTQFSAQAGLTIRTSGGRLSSAQLALENVDLQETDAFWEMAKIDGTRWNQNFPYELVIVEAVKGGGYLSTPNRFVLPIPPSDLGIFMPFAINQSVTLGGIVEEHNGAPIRPIQFSGTFGVLPLKGIANLPQDNSGKILPSILAGTIRSANSIPNSAVAATSGRLPFAPPNLHTPAEFEEGGEMEKATGYYQFRLLQHFLESYSNKKKLDSGKNLRLAVCIWKDEAVYLVTPVSFDVRRSSANPWEYNYSLSFRAFKRISLDASSSVNQPIHSNTRSPSMLAQVLNRIQAARQTMEALKETIGAVRGDVSNVLSIAREVAFFCKDALGVAITAADLPEQIVADFQGSVLASFNSVGRDSAALKDLFDGAAVRSDKASTGANLGAKDALGADPVVKIFQNPADNYPFFSRLDVGKLSLAPDVTARILRERERVRQLQRLDFEHMRDDVRQLSVDYSFDVGMGSDAYAENFSRSDSTAKKIATQDDYDVLFALNNMVQELNRMAAAGSADARSLSPLEYVAGLANRSGIAFRIPKSKYPVPFPYGFTLERLAAIYLNDPNRWHEIAVLNGLREPYVDEVGFEVPMIAIGSGLKITVASAANLFVGQPITLTSTTTTPTKRLITGIDTVTSGIVIISVNGDPDMENFTPLTQGKLHAFLPDTVNSQMTIYIPSDIELDDETFGLKGIPGLEDTDHLLDVAGVDLLLSSSGDLVFTPDGDARLAVGLTNLVQRVKVALSTPRGSLLQHPGYGINLNLGGSTADISAQDVLTATKDLMKDDPAFTGVYAVQVVKAGPILRLTFTVGIAGSSQLVPVSVDI